MLLTPRQVALVQDSFETIYAASDTAAKLFYEHLFEIEPAIRPLFKQDLQEQCDKFVEMLHMIILNLGRLDAVTASVEGLGVRHTGYGASPVYYQKVGEALLWMLEQQLGADFTPEIQSAWVQVYATLSGKMLEAKAS